MQKSPREITLTAILLGAILSVVMGAANVYLALKAGMTVSASIPAAVVAMGILAGVARRRNVLEANMVQTGASAGESLAAGVTFTLPALLMIGYWQQVNLATAAFVSLAGGLLGILFMIPMRRVFIAGSPELPYPEGIACAAVLRAGSDERISEDEEEASTSGLRLIVGGLLVGGLLKIAGAGFGLIRDKIEMAAIVQGRVFYFGLNISPALVAVGLIVGLPIASQVFAGGVIGWIIALPALGLGPLGPAADGTGDAVGAIDAAWALWSGEVRYLGVGAMIVGGIASVWKVRHGLIMAVREMWRQFRPLEINPREVPRTERDLSGKVILVVAALCILLTFRVYLYMTGGAWAISALTLVVMIVMAFFFTAVASYIVGLVGNSNSPVSGMTITALLATAVLISVFGFEGTPAMVATLGVAGVVCCAACTAGDVCNDLKTGHLLGATPRSQQLMQILGVAVACLVMGPVLNALHVGSINQANQEYERAVQVYEQRLAEGKEATPPRPARGGIGGSELTAPQATLMATLVRGFFGNQALPWSMIVLGGAIGIAILVAGNCLGFLGVKTKLHLMPIAVGIYLPLQLSTSIFLGGLLHALIRLAARARRRGDHAAKRTVLIASGLIAGESLAGVGLGLLAYYNVQRWNLVPNLPQAGQYTIALGILALLCGGVVLAAIGRDRTRDDSPFAP